MNKTTCEPGIEAVQVSKSFGDRLVLDQVNLAAEEGSIVGLLGPNGAGKTTIVRILSTLIPADSGIMRVAGRDVATDPDGVRAVIGVTGQFSAVDDLLTGTENLRLMTDLRHLGRREGTLRIAELLERFELTDAADRPLSTYSGGMRRRLDLAMTLVGDPRVIFLDEPTTGLDPRSRRTMWQIIRELAGDGVTILLTTQYLDEADQLADRIAVLDRGRIVAEGTPAELKRPDARWPRPTSTSPTSECRSQSRAFFLLPRAGPRPAGIRTCLRMAQSTQFADLLGEAGRRTSLDRTAVDPHSRPRRRVHSLSPAATSTMRPTPSPTSRSRESTAAMTTPRLHR